MRYFLFLISFLLFQFSALAQEDFLAKQYFNDGDYEKAVVFYEKLAETNPRRTDYAEGLIACYQQLERYTEAEAFLLEKLKDSYAFPTFYIELGYNYTLQDQADRATEYYDQAIKKIDENPQCFAAKGIAQKRPKKSRCALERAFELVVCPTKTV